ncbi:MAG: hypothetical protein ACREXS_05600 [Gammaproteobacteria bacterium]
MKFRTPCTHAEFEISDEWWSFAEMESFRPVGGGFYPYSPVCANLVEVVSLSVVEPPKHDVGVPRFKKYKMVPVLLAFQSPECALPPVEVVRLSESPRYQFRVRNGYHRFYASVAVGYHSLPVVVRGS